MTHAEAPPTVEVEDRDAVRYLRMSRPEKRNAINGAMLSGLHAALDDDLAAAGLRVVVLTGAGDAFCAGADIAEYVRMDPAGFRHFTDSAGTLCERLATLPVPVIAAVNGAALGGGFELVLSCDLVVAANNATFGLPEINLGLIPGWGGTQRLVQYVGPNRAREMVLFGTRLSATDAAGAGLVNSICDQADLAATAEQLALALAARPSLAIAAARNAIDHASPQQLPGAPGFAVEQRELMDLFESADGREGMNAFAQKRAPVFGSPKDAET